MLNKSYLRVLLGCTLCLTLVACGGGDEEAAADAADQQTPNVGSTPNPAPTPDPIPQPDPGPQPAPEPDPAPTPEPSAKVSATVSWDIPIERENGDDLDLSEIGGYEIIFRRTGDTSFTTVVIDDPTAIRHVVRDLPVGEYEFMIAAFDTEGLYSDFSDPTVVDLG